MDSVKHYPSTYPISDFEYNYFNFLNLLWCVFGHMVKFRGPTKNGLVDVFDYLFDSKFSH